MWVFKTVNKILIFIGLVILDLNVYAKPDLKTRSLAQRTSRIKKGQINLPKTRRTFKKSKKKTLLKYIKPPSHSKLYFEPGTDEAELEKVILMEIQQLYRLLQTSRRPDIQIRLASLYVEQSRLIESRIYNTYNQEMEKYKQNERSSMPRLNLKAVQEYSKKAINLFESYLQKYPKSRQIDNVLFHLAYSYFQMGKAQKGTQYYERLVQNYPKSDYVESAYFQLGEFYFDQRNWKKAKRNYESASRFNGKFYSFSTYKTAWCLYNEGKIDLAMRFMVRVIRSAQGEGRRSRVDFSNEALNDLASFYIYSSHKSRNIFSFFRNLVDDEEKLFRLFERAAYAYKDAGYIDSMRFVFNSLISLNPYHPKAYDYKYQIVQAYSYAGKNRLFNQEFKEWVRDYGKNSVWNKKNSSDSDLIQKVNKLLELSLRNYAFRMHHAFLKTKRKDEKNQSLFGYELYFQSFKDSPFYPEVRFHYGELLFDINQFKKAAGQYEIVIKQFPKSKTYETALLNRVLALEKTLPSEKEVQRFTKGAEKTSLPKNILDFQEAVDDYTRRFPKKKNVSNMLYTLGKILSEYKHHDKAVQYWMKIIQQNSSQTSSIVTQAVHSILDTYNLIKNYAGLEEKAKLFINIPAVLKSPVAQEIRKILREIQFKKAQDLAQSGKISASAELYEKFYRSNSQSQLAVPALYNSALNYKKAGNNQKAVELYERLLRRPQLSKHSKIQKQTMQILPDFYQIQGLYLKAAYAFKNYAKLYSKEKGISQYWYNSAIIFDGLNFYDSAVSAYLKYKSKTSSVDRNQIYFLIARIRERQGQKSKAIGNYKQYLNTPDKNKRTQVMAGFQIARLSQSLNQHSSARKWYQRTIRLYRQNKTGLSFAAQSQFYFAYEKYKKFKSARIPRRTAGLDKAVQNKLNLLESLKNEVKKVIRMNHGPQVIASLTLMALANDNMGKVILKSVVPKGLSRENRKKYKEGLAQAAKPFIDSAQQYLEQTTRKAKDVKEYSAWLKEARLIEQPLGFKEKVYNLQILGMEQ